jgi:DNA mismatch endonuclease (patch repair protein)
MDRVSRKRRSKMMARVRSKNTEPERKVRRLVYAMGFRYRLHVRNLAGTPDMVFRKLRKAIFVHGCFWHGHTCARGSAPSSNVNFWLQKIAANRCRDHRSQELLRANGWSVLTVWECELKDTGQVKNRLARFLSNSRGRDERRV